MCSSILLDSWHLLLLVLILRVLILLVLILLALIVLTSTCTLFTYFCTLD